MAIMFTKLTLCEIDDETAFEETYQFPLNFRVGDPIQYHEAAKFYSVVHVGWELLKAPDGELRLYQMVHAVANGN